MESQRYGKLYLQALFCEYNIKRGDIQKLFDQFECSIEMIGEMWENVKRENSASLFENLLIVMKGFMMVNQNHSIGKDRIDQIVRQVLEKYLDSSLFVSNYFQANLSLKNHCNTAEASKERNVISLCLEILLIYCGNRDVECLLPDLNDIMCNSLSRFKSNMNKSLAIVAIVKELFQIMIREVLSLGKSSDSTLEVQALNKNAIDRDIRRIVNFEFQFNLSEFENIDEEEPQKETITLIQCITTILEESKEFSHKLQSIHVLSLVGMLSENYSFKMVPLLEKTIMFEPDENLRFASITTLWELMLIHPSLQNYNMMLSTDFGSLNFQEEETGDVSLLDFALTISSINEHTKRIALLSALRMIRKQKCIDISVEHRLFSFISINDNDQDPQITKFLSKYTLDSEHKQIVVTPKNKRKSVKIN